MKNDDNILKNLLDSIPHRDYYQMKDTIVGRCGITHVVLRFWIESKTAIPLLAKKEIEAIIAEYEGLDEKYIFPELHQDSKS
jgi:hypothetical protein